jgi:hypothetical protein
MVTACHQNDSTDIDFLLIAVDINYPEIVELLRKHGAKE